MNINENISQNIRLFMHESGVNMRALSLKAGLKEDAVRNVLEKAQHPRVDTLYMIARAMNLTVSELIGEAPPVQRGTLDHAAMLAAVEAVETFFAEVAPRILSKEELAYFRTPPVKARIILLLYEKVVSGKMQTDQLPELIETARMLRVGEK